MSKSTNSEAVFGSDIKRLPFKDLIKRIGPGLIATGIVIGPGAVTTSAMLGANYGYALIWLIFPIIFMGITFMMVTNRLAITTGLPTIHAIRKYYGISGCWYRCLYGMSLFYHGQYFRYRRGHEPDLWDQLENRLFDYDCHCPLLLLCQECLF